MYCKFCGKSIDQSSIFCPSCGKNINETMVNAVEIPKPEDKDNQRNYSSLFWKYFWLSALIYALGSVSSINSTLAVVYLIVLILFVVSFCRSINKAMQSVGKRNWWPLGLLIIIPFGFWITFFVVRHHLKPAGKWGKDSILMIILIVLVVIAVIGILAGMVLVSMNGARLKARDTRREADMRQLISAQELYYNSNNAYLTCSTTGGDCIGKINNYPAAIGTYLTPTPIDPSNDGSVCGTNYTYCGFDNTVDFGTDFCYFAKLEGGGYYIASSNGNYLKSSAPIDLGNCLSKN